MENLYVLRVAPIKPEYGNGFIARVFDVRAKQSILAPSTFATYEAARNWAMAEGHRLMGDRPYRRCYSKKSRASQNLFYTANIWA